MTAKRENKFADMSDEEFNRPRYPISVVANLLDVHQQTLRLYEREGLVKPQRTPRNTRMYSESDVEQLRSILSLTDIGVNLAGGLRGFRPAPDTGSFIRHDRKVSSNHECHG